MFFSKLRNADTLLAAADRATVEEYVCQHKEELHGQQINTFPSFYDGNTFFPIERMSACESLQLDPSQVRLAVCGRLNAVKGWDLLLRSFLEFRRRTPHAQLVFIGDGEDRPKLLATSRSLGIAEQLLITGFMPPERVNLFLNASDVVLFGSRWEGWSNAMVEALACGKPIVSTEVSAVRDCITDGVNGLIVKQRDPRTFASAIESACRLPSAPDVSLQSARQFEQSNIRGLLSEYWQPAQ